MSFNVDGMVLPGKQRLKLYGDGQDLNVRDGSLSVRLMARQCRFEHFGLNRQRGGDVVPNISVAGRAAY